MVCQSLRPLAAYPRRSYPTDESVEMVPQEDRVRAGDKGLVFDGRYNSCLDLLLGTSIFLLLRNRRDIIG